MLIGLWDSVRFDGVVFAEYGLIYIPSLYSSNC